MAAAQQEEYKEKAGQAASATRSRAKAARAEPTPPSEVPDAKVQYNFTDPESRIMKAGNGSISSRPTMRRRRWMSRC